MNGNDFVSREWHEALAANGLDTFEQIWPVAEDAWFEPPNQGRGGWSGVTRQELTMPDGSHAGIFVKRQENHIYYSWRRFFRPTATLEREFRNCLCFRELGIPSMELLYYAERRVDGKLRAILITRELEGYYSLESTAYRPIRQMERQERDRLITSVAGIIRQMHMHRFQHTCLYPKHLLVKKNSDGSLDARFIDLEKTRWLPFRRQAVLRDLDSLQRHAQGWGRADRLRFFLAYLHEKRLNPASKRLLRAILGKRKR
jgi:hypothetical protein